jgi:hypothetical protein
MAFSPADFAADTDFERFAIERLGTHRVRPADPGATFDVRGGTRHIAVAVGSAVSGSGALEAFRESLAPLSFGAAYKVLDKLVEHVLWDNGSSGRLRFDQKTQATPPSRLPAPLDIHRPLWESLYALYVEFADARHAVTHRRASVGGAGDLVVHDDSGTQTDTLTATELTAFSAAVHATAELVIDASGDARRVNIVEWYLDQLQPRHRLPLLGAADVTAGSRLLLIDVAEAQGVMTLDLRRAREVVAGQPSTGVWDIRMYDNASHVYVARWEDLPPDGDTFQFRREALPDWLTEQVSDS